MNSDDLFTKSSQSSSQINSKNNSFQKLLNFLNRLDDASLPYTFEHNSDETLMVLVSIEGERWEVEFFANGEVQVEVFYSVSEEGDLEGEEALDRLFLDEEDLEDDEEGEDELEDDEDTFDEDDSDDDEDFDEEDDLDNEK